MSISIPPGVEDDRLPFKVTRHGCARWMTKRSYQREISEVMGIELVLAGNSIYEQGHEKHTVGPGEIFILRQNRGHQYSTGPAGFVHKRFINLEGSALAEMLRATGLAKNDHVKIKDPARMERLFREVGRRLREQKEGFRVEVSCLAARILIEAGQSVSSKYPYVVSQALAYMEENARGRVTLRELTEVTKMSQAHFCRTFKMHTGLSPIQYFLQSKMREAKKLLDDTDDTISDIAATVGIDEPLYFSRQFKKHTGVSPSEWRANTRRDESLGQSQEY